MLFYARKKGFTPPLTFTNNRNGLWFFVLRKWSSHKPTLRKKLVGGFTALELLMVIAIIGLLAAIIISPFASFRNSKVLDTTSEETLALLSEARGNTLSAKAGYQYGVHFEASQIVLYRGATYSSSDVNNKVVVLDNALEVSSIALTGGGSDVLFEKLSGKTSKSGTVVIRVKSDTAKLRTITIAGTGIASGS